MTKEVKNKIDFLKRLLDHTIRYIPKVRDGLMERQAEKIKAEIRELQGKNKPKKRK